MVSNHHIHNPDVCPKPPIFPAYNPDAHVWECNGVEWIEYDRHGNRVFEKPLEIRTTSSTGGEKGTKLERFDLIPVGALSTVAHLYGKGAAKYSENNWRKGYEWSKSYSALQRHANAFWNGEDLDPEMQLPHMASVIFHALALITFMQEQPGFDDRFKSVIDIDGGETVDENIILSDLLYSQSLDALKEFKSGGTNGETV